MSGYFKSIFLILLIAIGVVSCSLIPNELETAEKLIETNPDSALHILQAIRPEQYKSDENRALYGFLMFQALDKKMLPLKPDSLLNYSISYYQQHSDKDKLAICYFYKGRTYKNVFQYEKAVDFFLKALDEIHDKENFTLYGRINSDLGDIYNIQGDFILARQKYKIAYDYFSKSKYQLLAFYSSVNIGRTYHDAKEYRTAAAYYKKILPQAIDSIQQGALYQEIGLNYYDFKKLDSALFYYKKIVSYPYIKYNKATRYFMLANIYFDLNKIDSAYYYASNTFKYNPPIRTQRDCYRILTNSEYLRGNMRDMSIYMNKYVNLSDSIRKIDAQIKGSYMETTHNAKKEAAKNKYISWYLAGLVLLLFISGYILYRWFTRRNRQKTDKILETHTEEKVGIHKKVIEDKRTELQQQIEDRKRTMQADFKNAGSQEREQQLRKIYKEILHFDDSQLFFNKMDKFLNGLITKLKNRYSTITEKDLMLCCYILLHIPTYDMLILFDYKGDNSLKSLKRRLPPKFNLENATMLEAFLLAILSED